jgi:hypothetical protein
MPAGFLPIKPAQICAALGVALGPAGVCIAVAVRVRASVAVVLGCGVSVAVTVGVLVDVAVGIGVLVAVALGKTVAVAVGVGVGVLAHAPKKAVSHSKTNARMICLLDCFCMTYPTIALLHY